MATTARAVVTPFPRRPVRAPVDWRILGDLLQLIAAKGDRDFLDMVAKTAHKHLELLASAEQLIRK